MPHRHRLPIALVLLTACAASSSAQPYPNPYRMVEGWAKLPGGRTMGAVGDVRVDPDGKHLWAVVRCEATAPDRFGNECLDSDLDPVVKFELATGKAVASFGGGMFIWPHGLDVDARGNVWVTDAVLAARTPKGTRGHQVVKFSPAGEVLLRLGTPGASGAGEDHFDSPADVVVGDGGAIFVADGHAEEGNNRIVKLSPDGKFLQAWGKTGYAPGEFHTLHALAIDQRGRLLVADRGNNRIQIFDQEGDHLATWTQFGRPSGIYFGPGDAIYVTDSESDDVQNPGWEMGIRIGDAKTGWVRYFVRFPWGDPRETRGSGAEFVAVDNDGNLYAGEPFRRVLQKYVRVMP